MAEPDRIHERLDEAVDALLRGNAVAASDADVAMLLVIADDLRGLPDPRFRSSLRTRLFPGEATMNATVVARPGVQTITPYLVVNGAAELIQFMKSAFGATENVRVPAPDGRLMHAEVRIGDSRIELGDAPAGVAPRVGALHLYVENVDEAYERALAAGASSIRPPADQAYGDRDASVRDRFGNHWYIGRHQENVTEEELMRRFAGTGSKPRRDPAVPARPEGFRTVTPFLHPRGVKSVIDFLRIAFGAADVHPPTVMPDGSVAYAAMSVGDSVIEMGEAHGEFAPMPFDLHVQVIDADAAYERALQAGARSIHPPANQPYGERNAAVEDPAGNHWYLGAPL